MQSSKTNRFGIMAVGAVVALSSAANAADFRSRGGGGDWANSNTWEELVGGNWTNTANVPGAGDFATIRNLHPVGVSSAEAADHFTIESGATLTIQASGTLTVDDDAGAGSVIDGDLFLASSTSVLSFTEANQTLTRSNSTGKIDGQHNDAQISIASGIVLESEISVEGRMTVTGAGTFRNLGQVKANDSGGTMLFAGSLTLDDSAGTESDPRWRVFGNSSVLQFDVGSTGLDGYFLAANGELEVNAAIQTSADLLVGTGGLVDLNAEMCVQDWRFIYAGSQSGCGGTVDTLHASGLLRYDTFDSSDRSGCSSCADPGGAGSGCRSLVFDDNSNTFTCN